MLIHALMRTQGVLGAALQAISATDCWWGLVVDDGEVIGVASGHGHWTAVFSYDL